MPASALIFPKKDYSGRDGCVPLYLRVSIDGKPQNPISLKKRIPLDQWDETTRKAKKSFPNAKKFNIALDQLLARANEIILDHELTGRFITYETFTKEWSGQSAYDYYDQVTTYIKSLRDTATEEYIYKVETVTNKVRDFAPVLQLGQIDFAFLTNYRQHLATVRKNGKNTIHSNMRIMRRILKDAINRKLLKENPFDNFPLEKVKVQKEVLEPHELKKYEELLQGDLVYYLRKTLCWFLLAVYSGRRYQDIKTFPEWTFYDDHIRIIQMKRVRNRDERKITMLYMNSRIRSIVQDIRAHGYQPIQSNNQANKFLKQLNELLGIDKRIRFHEARHSFNHINKKLATDLGVRKDLLGHDSINSTMQYEHTDPDMLKSAMLKWNDLG